MTALITRDRFDAVLFDLDGVVTTTAGLHAAAWKATFDPFLARRAAATGTPFVPFDLVEDYARYVDGRPRPDGIRTFLRSRGIALPEGGPDSPAGEDSVHGLGEDKNARLHALIETQGVDVFPDARTLIERVRRDGIKTAVVSSSRNCERILRVADLESVFDVRVDGVVSTERNLRGKPAPDTFLAAARELGVRPERAVLIEDAIPGVRAGRAGGFGLVVGVARGGGADALRAAGADRVVGNLGEL
jgi:beta-phosphoglucomutase family hydrolase